MLRVAIQGISDLISKEAYINRDFADVCTVMRNMGQAIMGTGVGTGDNRAVEAAEKAIRSPLLDDCRIDGAKGILLNISGPSTMTLMEVQEAASFITDHADENATIIFGARIDETIPQDQLEVTVIAAGFGLLKSSSDRALENAEAYQAEAKRSRPTYKVFSSSIPQPQPAPEEYAPETAPLRPATVSFAPAPQPAAPESPATDAGLSDDPVFELDKPIQEAVETQSQIPSSYRPEEKRPSGKPAGPYQDLDIPAFIRKRYKRFNEDE